MPLLTPNSDPAISRALAAAGLAKPENGEDGLYEKHQLSDEDVIMQLASMAHGAGSESLRLRAIELAMKAKKMLSPDANIAGSTFNIIINDPNGPKGINPILIPREVQI